MDTRRRDRLMPVVRGGDKMARALSEMAAKLSVKGALRVGFLNSATYPDGTSVALVASVHEFGSRRVPMRSFFRPMVKRDSKGWSQGVATQLRLNNYDVAKTLNVVGAAIKGQLQMAIKNVQGPPLAPATVARKGFDTLLIDTSHMINSVDWEVTDA